jgi:excisionase family DNA binding protein
MATQTVQHAAPIAKERATLSHILSKRVEGLIGSVLPEIEQGAPIHTALELTDSDLMKLIVASFISRNSRVSPRELKKINRRIEGTFSFYEMLKSLGGTLRVNEVASLLNVTRQTVHNYIKRNELLAVKPGNEYLFPLFQFETDGISTEIQQILKLLPDDISPVTKVSFFTSTIVEKENKTIIDILKTKNVPSNTLSIIKNRARVFGRQMG